MKRTMTILAGISAIAAIGLLAACGSTAAPAPTAMPPTQAPATQATAAPAPESTATVAPTAAAPATEATAEVKETRGPAEAEGAFGGPSNKGNPGEAINLVGDATAGAQVYVDKCKRCHGDEGKGGVDNSGSDDGAVPGLNPIDEEFKDNDPKVIATRIDLYIELGSTPTGTKPDKFMPAYGTDKRLTQQQIADVIAYIMSLNK